MAKKPDFFIRDIVPAVFTPFKENGELDLDKLSPYCEHLLKHNIKHVFVNGTTGEGKSLTIEERKLVTEKWIEVSAKRLCVMVHIGGLNLRDSKMLARHAKDCGVDAIASLPPLFFKPNNTDALVEYCKNIAAAAPGIPFYYYHIPSFTNVNLNMEEFLTKANKDIPTLVGIKFSDKDLVDLIGCSFIDNGRLNILYGCDQQLMAGLVMGSHGAVGSLYNFMPDLYHRLLSKMKNNDLVSARKEQVRTQQFCKLLEKYGRLLGGPVAALKVIMDIIGLDLGPPREPMRRITDIEKQQFQDDLRMIGFLEWC